MRHEIDIPERAYEFALRIVRLVQRLPQRMEAQVLGKQLLRSATSIAANVEEAQGGFSKDDFIFKMSIAFKESRETHLWLRFIQDSKIIEPQKIKDLFQESIEIRNILGTIVKHARLSNSKTLNS